MKTPARLAPAGVGSLKSCFSLTFGWLDPRRYGAYGYAYYTYEAYDERKQNRTRGRQHTRRCGSGSE